jgi:hypothetical protein
MKNLSLLFILLILGLAACVKPPIYPMEPVIEFKSVSSSFVKSGYSDTITFTFTDGDGDIGVNPSAADTCNQCSFKTGDSTCLKMRGFNVFLIDIRDTCVGSFASANIEQQGRYDDISGEIAVIRAIDSKKCFAPPTPGCPKDTVVYTIILRDKAGNFSNAIKTTPIIIDGE